MRDRFTRETERLHLRSFAIDPARGLVVDLIAALGSCGAAIVAVVIATDSRRERKTERLDAAKAQAKLVLIDVALSQSSRRRIACKRTVNWQTTTKTTATAAGSTRTGE